MRRYKNVTVNGKQMLEHKAVWESVFGPIPKGYVIHHLNGDGRDNRIDNLMILPSGAHSALHAEMRAKGIDVVDPTDPAVVEDREKHKRWHASHKEQERESVRAYREANREHLADVKRRWDKNNPDKVKSAKRRYYDKHSVEICQKQKAYAAEHKDELREYRRMYSKTHRDIVLAGQRRYHSAHKDEMLAKHREYNEKHRELIAAKAKLVGAKRKKHPNPDEILAAEKLIDQAIAKEIAAGIRSA